MCVVMINCCFNLVAGRIISSSSDQVSPSGITTMGRKRKFQESTSCQAEGTCPESRIDRFSDLPDEFAHHIPSSLDHKGLTRVGAVSKRTNEPVSSEAVELFRSIFA